MFSSIVEYVLFLMFLNDINVRFKTHLEVNFTLLSDDRFVDDSICSLNFVCVIFLIFKCINFTFLFYHNTELHANAEYPEVV